VVVRYHLTRFGKKPKRCAPHSVIHIFRSQYSLQ
jgi:hypothetical protein